MTDIDQVVLIIRHRDPHTPNAPLGTEIGSVTGQHQSASPAMTASPTILVVASRSRMTYTWNHQGVVVAAPISAMGTEAPRGENEKVVSAFRA